MINGNAVDRESVPSGTRVTISADASGGWVFDRWDGLTALVRNPLNLVVKRDTEVTAVFKQRWNFLVYLAADNDLEEAAYGSDRLMGDFQEMEQIGSSDHLEILVLADRMSTRGTLLYRILKDTGRGFTSEVLAEYPELAMDDPGTLTDFLVYAAENYPAQHTVLTLWDHGSGVYPRGIGYDYTSLNDAPGASPFYCLTTDEVAQALSSAREKTGVKPDIIQTDACLMQMLEIAWEWENETDYLVGSEAEVPIKGNDYIRLLSVLSENPGISPRMYAEAMVDIFGNSYRFSSSPGITFSAIDTGDAFDELRAAFTDFASVLSGLTDTKRQDIMSALSRTTDFGTGGYYKEFIDLTDFVSEAQTVFSESSDENVSARLRNALTGAVINQRSNGSFSPSGPRSSSGLSILLPLSRFGLTDSPSLGWETYRHNGYGLLKLAKETQWDEFLDKLYPL